MYDHIPKGQSLIPIYEGPFRLLSPGHGLGQINDGRRGAVFDRRVLLELRRRLRRLVREAAARRLRFPLTGPASTAKYRYL